MASHKISEIEGIGTVYSQKLQRAGIRSVDAFLKKGCTRQGRRELAAGAGIDETLVLKWVNMADLFRITGIGSEYSHLLEKAGVDSVKELRNRKPENLHAKLEEVNSNYQVVRQLPSLAFVESWVAQAKELAPMITY